MDDREYHLAADACLERVARWLGDVEELVVEQRAVVGPDVQAERKGRGGVDAVPEGRGRVDATGGLPGRRQERILPSSGLSSRSIVTALSMALVLVLDVPASAQQAKCL
jgi:hypothetical protein